MFRLHENGELIDTYNSNPEYFGRAKAAERRAAAGRAQKWKELLSPGRKVTQLREAFKGEDVIVDEKLLAVAALVGIDPDLAVMSHRYLVEDGQPDLLACCSRLSLRRLPLAPEVAAQIHLKPVDSSFERIHPFDGERWIGESAYLQPSFGCAVPLSRSVGVQACIGRQDWGPTGGSLRDAATPYEEVLNHFPPHRLASTLPHRLRNFASELWLGPAMQTALRRDEVESVAMLEAIGNAWHLTIRPGRTLAELESVLEAIRPRRPTTEEVLAMERTQTRTGDV